MKGLAKRLCSVCPYVAHVYSTLSNDRGKRTTLVTSPVAFSSEFLLHVLSAGACPQKALCRQRAWLFSWLTLAHSPHSQCNRNRKPLPLLVLQEMLSACFLMSFKPSSTIPSAASITPLPFLTPYRVSVVFALSAAFMFQHCIWPMVSFVTPWPLMIFSSSVPRKKKKNNYLQLHLNFCNFFTDLFTWDWPCQIL